MHVVNATECLANKFFGADAPIARVKNRGSSGIRTDASAGGREP